MSDPIKNRREIIFIYDVVNANPNGDPVDENKPRIDEEAGINIVTDVRLKRTVRDYLHDFREQDIFVREIRKDDRILKSRDERLSDFGNNVDEVLKQCVDIRLFGATIAVKGNPYTYVGPVQFKFGRSLHRVSSQYIRGTTVMPSDKGKKQGTFTEEYRLPYSLICFYGIANENAAESTHLTEEDIGLLMDGLWNGTKNLITRSKFGHTPRLLIEVIYNERNFHIGELDRLLSINSEKRDEEIRDVSELSLEVEELAKKISSNSESIMEIRYKKDDRLKITSAGQLISLDEAIQGIKVSDFKTF